MDENKVSGYIYIFLTWQRKVLSKSPIKNVKISYIIQKKKKKNFSDGSE